MIFTKLLKLKNASEFDYQLIAQYKVIALIWLDPIRRRINTDAMKAFEDAAHWDPRTIYIYGEGSDEPINKLIGEFFYSHGKDWRKSDFEGPALGLVETSVLSDGNPEILKVRWIGLDFGPDQEDPKDELDKYIHQHSPEGYSLYEAIIKANSMSETMVNKTDLIKLLSKAVQLAWKSFGPGGATGQKV